MTNHWILPLLLAAAPAVSAQEGDARQSLALQRVPLAAAPAVSAQEGDARQSLALQRVLQVGFGQSEAWHSFADAPWWSLVDLRDMLSLFHPYSVSVTGTTAGAARQLAIPASWQAPFALRFYCADDYFADPVNHAPGQVGTESFFEHRFKQVLIDDTVVWERDVSDENTHGSQTLFQLDVTPYVKPGSSCKLTFRVIDRVSSAERHERDVWFIPGTWYAPGDGKTELPPRFHTAVWFADPVLGEKAAVEASPAGERPHEAIVAARHRARWPLAPLGGDGLSLPLALDLVAPAPLPAPGFPITCGIPMPPGMLRELSRVGVKDRRGSALPAQTEALGHWPDGSIRWLLLTALGPAGARAGERFVLDLQAEPPAAPPSPLVLKRHDGRLTIDTGPLRLELGASHACLIDEVRLASGEQAALRGLALQMAVLRDGAETPLAADWETLAVVSEGQVAARIELAGVLRAGDVPIGRFLFRLYAYAGLPTLQASVRIINDTKPAPYAGTLEDPPLAVTRLELVGMLPDGARGPTSFAVAGGEPLAAAGAAVALLQDSAEHFSLNATDQATVEGKRAQGSVTLSGAGGALQVATWRFWQQYPKSLAVRDGQLRMGLFAPSAREPAYRPRFGEAKRHDLVFSFSPTAPAPEVQEAVSLLADEPPRVFNRDWFCRSGGINVLDPQWFERHAELRQFVADTYGDVSSAKVTGQFGIRNFGDMPYNVSTQQWLNGYWAMVQGALNWGLASGDPRWLERSSEIARHIADVDCVHLPQEHPDWAAWHGLTCALSADHSVHGGLAQWPAFQIGESLLLHYWMTGDPDSLDAGLQNAEYLVRNQAGRGSSQAREQARPMLTLLRAWQATADARYREAATAYLGLQYQTEHVIEWRRGAYIQPTYQNWRCISAGLDSMYAHDVYEYYRLTGDVDAAQLVVALADSVYAESMLPQEEGLGSFLFYVRYSRASWYYTQMAMLFHMAFDLTEDVRFLRAGRAAFARYLLCVDGAGKPWYQPFHNFGWLDPELGGWLERFRDVPTAPFTITRQTPDPDPANYQP